MNVAASGTQGSQGSQGSTQTNSAERKATPDRSNATAQQGDAFERALRERQSQRDGQDKGDEQPSSETPVALPGAFVAALPVRSAEVEAPRSAPRTADPTPTGTRAAMEAALNANPAPAVLAVGDVDPAALWEASVGGPNSIPVEVRALRTDQATPQAQPGWSVSVSSSSVGADVLNRHAPRLSERLRKSAVGFTHVRIENQEDDAG